MTEPMRRKPRIPQLRVVFDTNPLYTENEDRLLRRDVANLINEEQDGNRCVDQNRFSIRSIACSRCFAAPRC